MRVLFIHNYYSGRGGEDLVFETESKLLARNGFTVDTLTFHNARFSLLKFIFYPFNVLSFFRTLRKLFYFKPDVVHIHNWHFNASLSTIIACKLMRAPIVQTMHNYRLICPTGTLFHKKSIYLKSVYAKEWSSPVIDKVYRDSKMQTFWVWFVATIYRETGIYKWVSRYIVLTPAAKEMFMQTHFRNLEERFIIKANFLEETQHDPRKRKPYFLFVGRLTYDKGITVLLEAFKNSPYQLKIVGSGPLKEKVTRAAETNKNIEYLGFQKFDVIGALMKECSAMIFPSISYEGMPMTILEAYSCGTPIIASKFSAMETMVEDGKTGLHFEKGNAEDLRGKVALFSSLGAAAEKYYENARAEFQTKYTPKINLQKLESIYADATASAKRSNLELSYQENGKS